MAKVVLLFLLLALAAAVPPAGARRRVTARRAAAGAQAAAAEDDTALGTAYAAEGRADAAYAAFHRALAANPLDATAAAGLAEAHLAIRAMAPDFALSLPLDLVLAPGTLSTSAAEAEEAHREALVIVTAPPEEQDSVGTRPSPQ